MFGTMRPVIGRMNDEEKKIFRAYYCSLCSSLGSFAGIVARMGLSYDITFLYMLMDAENERVYTKCFCPSNPLRRKVCVPKSHLSEYLAAISVILMYEKCIDNIEDNDNVFKARGMKRFLESGYEKAKEIYPEQAKITNDLMTKMRTVEKAGAADSAARLADLFGKLSGKLLAMCPTECDSELYYALGYHVGYWIYIIDAICDIEEDCKKGRFNPFVLNSEKSAEEILKDKREEIEGVLFNSHDCIMDVLKLTDITDNRKEIENIIKMSLLYAEGRAFNLQKENSDGK